MMKPRDIVRKEYGDARNFITPRVLGYGKIPCGAYELSRGTDFGHKPIFGVSVVRVNEDGSTSRDLDLSKCFVGPTAREDAREYIKTLRR